MIVHGDVPVQRVKFLKGDVVRLRDRSEDWETTLITDAYDLESGYTWALATDGPVLLAQDGAPMHYYTVHRDGLQIFPEVQP